MSFFSFIQPDASIMNVLLRENRRYRPLEALTQRIMRGPSSLPNQTRELIAAYVSFLNECQYCHGVHKAVAIRFGIDEALFEALSQDLDNAPLSPKVIGLLHYAKKLTEAPGRISKTDFDKAIQLGNSEDEISDTVAITSLFNLYNRLMDGHGVKGTAEIYDYGAGFLHKKGYVMPFFIKPFFRKKYGVKQRSY